MGENKYSYPILPAFVTTHVPKPFLPNYLVLRLTPKSPGETPNAPERYPAAWINN